MKNPNSEKEYIKKFVTEVWCNRDASKILQYYDQDFIGILNGDETFNLNDVYKRLEYSKQTFEKNEPEFVDIFMIADDLIGARINMNRTDQNKQNKKVSILLIVKKIGNKINKLWLFTDLNYKYKNWD